jgi:acetyl esterase/lipase
LYQALRNQGYFYIGGFVEMIQLLWPEGAPFANGASDEDCPALTPFLIDGSNKSAVIVCPGGGYAMRASDYEGDDVARWLNTLGISAFVLRYRVAPYPYPCALLDAQRAIRFVRFHAESMGINAEKIGILGFSAGGHLAASVSTHYDSGDTNAIDLIEQESCRPDLLMLCYPVITMNPPYGHEGSRLNLLGLDPSPELIESMSNELQVTADSPPTFLWHTSDDPVYVENSLLYASALSRHKVPFDLHVYEKGRHGLGLAEDDEHVGTWPALCSIWLKRNRFR